MKKYFYMTNQCKISFLGEFSSFSAAWEYAEYDLNITFVWIFSQPALNDFQKEISEKLSQSISPA